jgi:hypothetical protein
MNDVMTLIININDALVERLKKKALAKHLSVEELATRLLGEAVEQLDDEEQWQEKNQRRLALIRKSTYSSLAAADETELQTLQSILDQRLEPVDDRLLGELERMRKSVSDPGDD